MSLSEAFKANIKVIFKKLVAIKSDDAKNCSSDFIFANAFSNNRKDAQFKCKQI